MRIFKRRRATPTPDPTRTMLLIAGPYDACIFGHPGADVGEVMLFAAARGSAVHAYQIETPGTASYIGIDADADTSDMTERMLHPSVAP